MDQDLRAALAVAEAPPRGVVLVEGRSDRAALEALAARRGRDLAAESVAVVALGGAASFGRVLERLGSNGGAVRVAGLYDDAEERDVRRALARAGMGTNLGRAELAAHGFHVCVADLEDELIRALGFDVVEDVIIAAGDGGAYRTFCRQPAQRTRSRRQRLRRFMGTKSGRKVRYGRLLVEALDLDRVPEPLDAVLAHV